MKYETVKGCGELGIEFDQIRGLGARVSKDFLRKLLKRIVKRSTKYYDETGEYVFYYREKQLHSVVCPSIADITPSFLMEHPLTRKPAGEEEYLGKVDYWISYRDYSFLMELKHSYFGYARADNPRKSIAKFMHAMKQLRSVRKKECRDNLTIGKGLIKIALETIVFYKGSKYSNFENNLKRQVFKDSFKKLVENTELKHRSNLRALWVLDERLVEPVEYTNSFQIYPAVAFVGNVWEIIE